MWIHLLALELIDGAGGGEVAAATPVAGYGAIKWRTKRGKPRYFIDLDGRRRWGSRQELERILDARARPPLAPAAAAPPAKVARVARLQAPPQPVAVPDLAPIDLSGVAAAQRAAEIARLMAEWDEEAAIVLLLH